MFLDATPVPSDWEDFGALWEDMRKFARENPDHTFICADDPGATYQPPRVARVGWAAFLEWAPCKDCVGETCEACDGRGKVPPFDERMKFWTITLGNLNRRELPDAIKKAFQTAAGRQAMLKELR
jgi:hypothetical protein